MGSFNGSRNMWRLNSPTCVFAHEDNRLTHWGRVTHICVSKLSIIGSDNGLSPDRRQAIIWTNDGIMLIGPLGKNFSEILIEILTFSFKKMHFKMSSRIWRSLCLGLNELSHWSLMTSIYISSNCANLGPVSGLCWLFVNYCIVVHWTHGINTSVMIK